MFKGTNKLAKVLAVALVLCMLPMAALADVKTINNLNVEYNEETRVAEVTGETNSAVVTLLAARVPEGTVFNHETFDFPKIVYVGQQAVSEGKFSVQFIPKANTLGGATITVYVGGEGVSTLEPVSFYTGEPAPSFKAEWYKGENLTIKLGGVTDLVAQNLWWEEVDVFKLGTEVIPKNEVVREDNIITFTAAYLEDKNITSITSITAEDNDGIYNPAKETGLNLPADKPAGTITAPEAEYVIAGEEVSLDVAAPEKFPDAWKDAVVVAGTVKFGGENVEVVSYEGTTLTVKFPIAIDAKEAEGKLTITVDNYALTESAAIKVVAPTVEAAKALEGKTLSAVPTGEEDALNGEYHVVLPTITNLYGSTLSWLVKVNGADADASKYIEDGKFDLTRAADADKTYQITAAVTKEGYVAADLKEFEAITIKKLGTPAFGDISSVAIFKGEEAVTEVTYAEGLELTAKVEGVEGVQATYVWTIGEETVSTEATYAPAVKDITKTIKVTATPAAPFKGEAVSAEVKIALDETYAPEWKVEFASATLRAGGTAEAVVTDDETYKEAPNYAVAKEDAKYYEVAAELVAEAEDKAAKAVEIVAGLGEELPEGVTLLEEAKYETAGNFAVIKVVATYTIGDKTFDASAKYAVLEVSKKSSPSTPVGSGPSLKPTKPADPKPEDPKPEEPKPEDPVSGEGNANGAAAFTDVDKTTYAWAYDGIDALAKAGVFKGMTPTTFGPELSTTNAQVIALAVRIAGLKAEDGAKTDLVAGDHWVYAEMAAAEKNEILGVFGGKVAVEEATTREVAFTLLYNALKAAGVVLPETAEAIEYSDASSIDAACVEAITALTKAGIVNGMGDGTLAPKATVTRAQLAKILGIAQSLIK